MKLILLFFNWIASPSARNDYLIYSEVDKNTLKEIENLVDEILKIKNKNFVGILNSKLVKYFICKYSDKTGAGDIMLNVQSLEKIPIPEPNENTLKEIEGLVDKVIKVKGEGGDSLEFEKKIDLLVYKLYNLLDNEIKIINGME